MKVFVEWSSVEDSSPAAKHLAWQIAEAILGVLSKSEEKIQWRVCDAVNMTPDIIQSLQGVPLHCWDEQSGKLSPSNESVAFPISTELLGYPRETFLRKNEAVKKEVADLVAKASKGNVNAFRVAQQLQFLCALGALTGTPISSLSEKRFPEDMVPYKQKDTDLLKQWMLLQRDLSFKVQESEWRLPTDIIGEPILDVEDKLPAVRLLLNLFSTEKGGNDFRTHLTEENCLPVEQLFYETTKPDLERFCSAVDSVVETLAWKQFIDLRHKLQTKLNKKEVARLNSEISRISSDPHMTFASKEAAEKKLIASYVPSLGLRQWLDAYKNKKKEVLQNLDSYMVKYLVVQAARADKPPLSIAWNEPDSFIKKCFKRAFFI